VSPLLSISSLLEFHCAFLLSFFSLSSPFLLLLLLPPSWPASCQDGRKFPEAKTVLQATAEANTRNAATLALKKYNEALDKEVRGGMNSVLVHREP